MAQDTEIKKDFFYSLTFGEDSSDDEEVKTGKVDNDQPASAEIDIWKELHEMSVWSSQETLAYDTSIHQPDILMGSDTLNNTTIPVVIPGKTPPPTASNAETALKSRHNSFENPVCLADADDDDRYSIWNYTLYDDRVKIPEIGTFKRKKNFNGLVTVQLIEKMLSQSIPPNFPSNTSL